MKSMMVGMVAVVFGCLVGCAASEEPTSEPTTDEVSENESAIIGTSDRHCEVVNGVLSGKCFTLGTVCSLSTTVSAKCPIGATALQPNAHYCSGNPKTDDFKRPC